MQSSPIWQEHLVQAKLNFKNASHLTYITLEILQENRLLIKILNSLHKSSVNLIKAFLFYEHSTNNIKLSKEPIKNLNLFLEKIAPKYLQKQEIDTIIEILKLAKQHKEAPLEFVKQDKFVIFNNGSYEILTLDKAKLLISNISNAISAFPIKT